MLIFSKHSTYYKRVYFSNLLQIILEKISKTCEEKSKEKLLTKTTDDDEDLSSDDEALQIVFTIASLLITHYDQVNFRV